MNYKGEIIDFNTNQILELKGYFPQNSPMKFSLSRKHMGNFSWFLASGRHWSNTVFNILSLDRQMPTTDVHITWFLKMFSLDDSFGHYD